MSAAEIAANSLKNLEDRDFKILYTLENALDTYQQIKIDYLAKNTKLHEDEVKYRLARLHKMKMISKGESGYQLISAGLDAIALKAFVKKGLISAFGGNVGVGKEADVFEVADETGKAYVIKFYRLGRTSFREVKKKRQILSEEESPTWLKACVNAAARESWALRKVLLAGGKVPETIARERHAILMQKIDGVLLSKMSTLDRPMEALRDILNTIKIAYIKAGIVNGDLSQYNILYDGRDMYIIDWPQAREVSKPESQQLLLRDLRNVITFFKRKHGIQYAFDKAYAYVTEPDVEF
ncbi:MAG: RIO1 family regulatory kinase/ATPase domain-containing protein [Nitrososphaeria archaeon]